MHEKITNRNNNTRRQDTSGINHVRNSLFLIIFNISMSKSAGAVVENQRQLKYLVYDDDCVIFCILKIQPFRKIVLHTGGPNFHIF